MKIKVVLLLLFCYLVNTPCSAGFDIKTSSIIDQPAVEILGDYNNCWYIIGFEVPNHPAKPARFYILKYAAGFPTAKSSPVYPAFGEKTDYLKAAIINGKISIFYSRTERLVERPNMVDSRDGYKQIPKIMRQDYDPVSLLPAGEPVAIFDESKEHFAASGIEISQSEDRSKTAILIKHYFRQSRFKVILFNNSTGPVFDKSFELRMEKNLVNFRKLVVSNTGQILLEAKTQEDPLHPYTKSKQVKPWYFFSINTTGENAEMLSLAPAIGGNQSVNEPMIAWLSDGQLLISYDHYANDHSPILKGISVNRYHADFTLSGTIDIIPDDQVRSRAASYQKINEAGLEFMETRQVLPLDGGGFMILAEFHKTTEIKDKISGISSNQIERNYIIAYKVDNNMLVKSTSFIDKKQSARNIGYAFSFQAHKQASDVYVLHNEDCDGDSEHGLNLLATKIPNTGEPVTQKIVHTSEDFFTSLEHMYVAGNQILFTEEKVVDFASEGRELKLLEIKLK